MNNSKLLSLLLACALALSVSACRQEAPEETSQSEIAESSEETASSEASLEPEEAEEPEESSVSAAEAEPETIAATPSEAEPPPAAETDQLNPGTAGAQSSALALNPEDVTIYVQDIGQYTVSDFSAHEDSIAFTNLINTLERHPSGGNSKPTQDAAFLLVRDDYQKFQYSLSQPDITVDNTDYLLPEEQYDQLTALAGAPVCGTYAQWLIYMNPTRVRTATYIGGDSSMEYRPGTDGYEDMLATLRWVGVVRGSGSIYTPGEVPLTDSAFQVDLLFDNDLHYLASFDNGFLYLESSDMSYGCQYQLSNPADTAALRRHGDPDAPPEIAQIDANPATGKPVIYLYPTKTQEVNVQLDFKGKLFYTFPTYNDGWNVIAQPDGTLTNKADSSTHYYLFWDGTAERQQWDFSSGFLVKGAEVEAFFKEKLPLLGLLPKEYNDFITYWTPKLMQNPYNLITFSTTEYEQTAPLTITPAPDTLLRVHMVYMPVYEEIAIKEQVLPKPPTRNGFTVVEWGGTLAG